MHDPMTVAFEIKYPWRSNPTPFSPKGNRHSFITVWHKDPERDGTDDSCGWFMRSRHGNKETLRKIQSDFKYHCYAEYGGWFDLDGNPKFSCIAITLGMFRVAAYHHFGGDWNKAEHFVCKHLVDLIFFAENPVDSLYHSITNYYGKEPKEYRVERWASCVYGWILRAEQPWYRHPRWHIHHWRLQVHPWQTLRRWLFERCTICGKGYPWGYCPLGNWSGTATWHHECDESAKQRTPQPPDDVKLATKAPTDP